MTALPDTGARRSIRDNLTRTLFVEAGAGSGKTTQLVGRIVALVTTPDAEGGVPMRHLAAVTFTEKAGAELRDRIRVALESRAREPSPEQAAAALALDELDTAAIGTLHSFARRLLSAHPIEAGLPPLVEVNDQVASQVSFERRWQTTRAELLADPSAAELLQTALASGITFDHMRAITAQLDANWDLVDDRLTGTPVPQVRVDATPLLDAADEILAQIPDCADDSDRLLPVLERLAAWRGLLGSAVSEADRLTVLAQLRLPLNSGRKPNWPDIDGLRAQMKALREAAADTAAAAVDAVLRGLLQRLASRTVTAARERQAAGQLEFHDLLVLARDMLRHNADVRASLQNRYRRLLLDEFQDTDPIQVELAVRIAGGAVAAGEDWRRIAIPAGSLFVVGDPKQSIYRFRRADIRTYLEAQSALGEQVALTTNFRSTAEVLRWVNDVFGCLIQPESASQPAYIALAPDPARAAWPSDGAGPPVVVLGAEAHPSEYTAADLRAAEAADVAGVVLEAAAKSWQVDRQDDGQWPRRPVRFDDITVLVPARTSIDHLEAAFDALHIPYRTEATSFTYQAREVRDVLITARAIDDPTDELAIVSALRTPLFGCGDDDLAQWRLAGGRWNPFAPAAGTLADSPVAAGLAYLAELARSRSLLAPSQLLDRIVAERRVLEVAAADSVASRHRETWRRIRFVLDQARAWSEAEHGSLREYLSWASRQAENEARTSEAVLPETDVQAVRITTIHAAKGLQFPMVIVSGLTSARPGPGARVLWEPGEQAQVHIRSGLSTAGYSAANQRDDHLEYCEDLRMLYVACTRAESRLVVSLHRRAPRNAPPSPERSTAAELLAAAAAGLEHVEFTADEAAEPLPEQRAAAVVPQPWVEWQRAHEAAVARSAEPAAVSATHLAHLQPAELPTPAQEGLAKQPRDLELPPWAKGRYGTAVGRAVHAVLQAVDLATGDGVDDLAAAMAVAEDVPNRAGVIAALARSALADPTVQRAATREHWKETYVGAELDGQLVEGYIDLMYREDDGSLVIVDYKTDAAPTAQTIAAYQAQVAIYARAVTRAVGDVSSSTKLVFCEVKPE